MNKQKAILPKESSYRKYKLFQPITLSTLLLIVVGMLFFKEATIGVHLSTIILAVTSSLLLFLIIYSEKKIVFPTKIGILFIFYLLWMFLSGYFSKDKGETVWEIVKMISLYFVFISIYTLTRKSHQIQTKILAVFVCIGSIFLLFDLYKYISSGDFHDKLYFIGSFYWHNQEAGFLIFLIPILLGLLLQAKKLTYKIPLLIVLFLSSFALVYTHSVGAWISVGGGILVFAFLEKKRIFSTSFLPIIILGFLFFIISFTAKQNPGVKQVQNIQSELSADTRSVSGKLRVDVWQNSIRIIKAYPIVGVGPGAYNQAYFVFQSEPWIHVRYAHNYYLQVGSELGIPGFILFLAIFICAVLLFFKKPSYNINNTPAPIVGLIAAIVASLDTTGSFCFLL